MNLPPLEPIPGMPDVWQYRGGVHWSQAPLPRRLHRCRPWTVGYLGQRIERCACGATRSDIAPFWHDRNSRRREDRTRYESHAWRGGDDDECVACGVTWEDCESDCPGVTS